MAVAKDRPVKFVLTFFAALTCRLVREGGIPKTIGLVTPPWGDVSMFHARELGASSMFRRRPLNGHTLAPRQGSWTRSFALPGSHAYSDLPYDVFLSYEYGASNTNHMFVQRVNDALKNRGFETFFDADRLGPGHIPESLIEGIKNSQVVLAFITKRYIEKVNSNDLNDMCHLEMKFALVQNRLIIPCIVEADLKNQTRWNGLRLNFDSHKYIDISSNFSAGIDQISSALLGVKRSARHEARKAEMENQALLMKEAKEAIQTVVDGFEKRTRKMCEALERKEQRIREELDFEKEKSTMREEFERKEMSMREELDHEKSLRKELQESLNKVQVKIDEFASKNNELEHEIASLKESPRQRQERYYEREEFRDMKDPLVSSILGSPDKDHQRYHSHLEWHFSPSRPLPLSLESHFWSEVYANLPVLAQGWHSYPYTEVLYPIIGELHIEADGRINRALPGEKIVVPAGTSHRIPPGSPSVEVAIAGGERPR